MTLSHTLTKSKQRVSGFTLIELLVVIAIIAVLAAIVIPIAKLVKEAGHSTHSLTNLKSIGTALKTYSAENDFQYPPIENEDVIFDWANKDIEMEDEDLALLPFWIKALIHRSIEDEADISVNVFTSPGIKWENEEGDKIDKDEILSVYGATDALLGFDEENELSPFAPRSSGRIEESSRTLMVVETQQSEEGRIAYGHVGWDDASRDLSRGDISDLKQLDYRFKKVLSALMADGSARSFRWKEKGDIEEPHWTGDDYDSIR